MNRTARFFIPMALVIFAGLADAREPVVGGPCQGCELVFSGMPDTLSASAVLAEPTEAGERMIITGSVKDKSGDAAQGIIVYAYQTNAEGIYPKADTAHGRLRAWAKTNESGRYRFESVRPGAYPGRSIPQHVHLHVIEPGKATYYIDDIVFSDDPQLTREHRQRMLRGRGGIGLCDPTRDDDGAWVVTRDITLGENIPGYGQ